MIPQRFIEEVQTRTDIAELIAGYIPLKKAGRNFRAICPFHGEKTPSFMISPQKQIFHCFGCGQGGGVLQFVMLYEKVEFVEAIEILAKRLGMEVPREHDPQANVKSRLYDLVEAAADFFYKNLLSDKGKRAVKYLAQRGVTPEEIKKFRLGLSLPGDLLVRYLREKGFTLQQMEQASLAIARGGSYHDLFRERLMFPICDVRSRPIAFGARLMVKDDNSPKYINSIEGILYSKRDHLYGLNLSRDAVTAKDNLIIVEGYLDMISPFARGVQNIAAALGTALTQEQIRIIRRYTQNVTLLFDADKAGQNATLRSLDLLLENDMHPMIVRLPVGDDPDTLAVREGAAGIEKVLAQKQDFFTYKLSIEKATHDIDSIEGKTKIAEAMLMTISRLSSEVSRYEYIKRLSSALQVQEEVLFADFKKVVNPVKKTAISGNNIKTPPAPEMSLSVTEKTIFKFFLANDKAAEIIEKNVKEEDLASFGARKIAGYLFQRYRDGKNLAGAQLLSEVPAEMAKTISSILMDEDIEMDKELLKGALQKIRKNRLKGAKDKLRIDIKEAERCHDAARLKELIGQYNKLNSEARND